MFQSSIVLQLLLLHLTRKVQEGEVQVLQLIKSVNQTIPRFDIDFSNKSNGSLEIKQGGVKIFSFNGNITHNISVTEIVNNSVKLLIESEPITLVLNVGEVKEVDMNSDNVSDIEIKLISLINGTAKLLINKLSGADILSEEEVKEETSEENGVVPKNIEFRVILSYWVIVGVMIVLLSVSAYLIKRKVESKEVKEKRILNKEIKKSRRRERR